MKTTFEWVIPDSIIPEEDFNAQNGILAQFADGVYQIGWFRRYKDGEIEFVNDWDNFNIKHIIRYVNLNKFA